VALVVSALKMEVICCKKQVCLRLSYGVEVPAECAPHGPPIRQSAQACWLCRIGRLPEVVAQRLA
jgi:hypothetical protein